MRCTWLAANKGCKKLSSRHHRTTLSGHIFVCVFCTLTGFSVAKNDRGVKFCSRVGLLSGQVFSPFGEHWLALSHGGGGITSGMNGSGGRSATVHGMGIGKLGRRRCLRPYGGVCVLQAC